MKMPSNKTISSAKSKKTIKIGVDLFVNLKTGSINKFYDLGDVLG